MSKLSEYKLTREINKFYFKTFGTRDIKSTTLLPVHEKADVSFRIVLQNTYHSRVFRSAG